MTAKRYKVSFWDDECSGIKIVVVASQPWEYTKNHEITWLKMVKNLIELLKSICISSF